MEFKEKIQRKIRSNKKGIVTTVASRVAEAEAEAEAEAPGSGLLSWKRKRKRKR